MATLKEGDAAPDFRAQTTDGSELSLSGMKGKKNVVLYFYPKDDTPGCTIEAKEFTEAADRFAAADTVVLGVSYDDADCHKAFIDKYGLKVQLLVDADKKIATAYGSDSDKGYPARNTFVIGKDGKIKKVYLGVKPQGHAQEVLNILNS